MAQVCLRWDHRAIAMGNYQEWCRRRRSDGGDSTEENPAQLPKASQLSSQSQYLLIEAHHTPSRCHEREYYKM